MSERTRIRGVAQREPARPRRAEGAAVLALQPAPGPRPAGERWEDSQATVAVRGELDRDALWAIDYTIGRASIEAGRIVLDLREVTHLDYAGVPELVARRRELRARGGELVVAVRNPYVANILKASGGAELVLCRTPDEAFTEAALANAGAARRRHQ
ncbi:MAG: STAS domain-containing protein [Deltaproteobacteria bacterium]|nr:MAG: STAS domain-containing protein [Deltaproteobacteria bacterium]